MKKAFYSIIALVALLSVGVSASAQTENQELIRVYPLVIEWCTQNAYRFTGREHIIAFDTKRAV